MKKAVQFFTPESLERAQEMSTEEIVEFLENFRELHSKTVESGSTKSKHISIKVPEHLLHSFKAAAELEGIKYQTLIKKLMKDWLLERK